MTAGIGRYGFVLPMYLIFISHDSHKEDENYKISEPTLRAPWRASKPAIPKSIYLTESIDSNE